MRVLDQIASALGRRDEEPNKALALGIADAEDRAGIAELMQALEHGKKDVQSDCIKVIYEIALLKPWLLKEHMPALIALLGHRNNRLQWGAMTALHALAAQDPARIYHALPAIIACADQGSVITNDHCVGILVSLAKTPEYADDTIALLRERLMRCPTNQLPMYAEQTASILRPGDRAEFVATLLARMEEVEQEPKRRRLEKVIKKCSA